MKSNLGSGVDVRDAAATASAVVGVSAPDVGLGKGRRALPLTSQKASTEGDNNMDSLPYSNTPSAFASKSLPRVSRPPSAAASRGLQLGDKMVIDKGAPLESDLQPVTVLAAPAPQLTPPSVITVTADAAVPMEGGRTVERPATTDPPSATIPGPPGTGGMQIGKQTSAALITSAGDLVKPGDNRLPLSRPWSYGLCTW